MSANAKDNKLTACVVSAFQKFFKEAVKAIRFLRYRIFEQFYFPYHLGYWPWFEKPQTFNEHCIRRKLYPPVLASNITDKYAARSYVSEKVGTKYLTRLYWRGSAVQEIDWRALPDRFVIKGAHGCGPEFIEIINSKETHSISNLCVRAQAILDSRYGFETGEYFYANIHPKLLIEESLCNEEGDVPLDYKFYVFGGTVHYIHVDFGRLGDHTRNIYTRDWAPAPFSMKRPLGKGIVRPPLLDEMILLAEKLGKGWDFVRVDLYCINDSRIVFGEITLVPGNGHQRFYPSEYDRNLGQLWKTAHTDEP